MRLPAILSIVIDGMLYFARISAALHEADEREKLVEWWDVVGS
jgi:hypothetical protein